MWDLVFVGKKENFAFSLQSLKLFCKGQFFDQAIICSQSKSYNPSLVMGFNIPTTGIAAVDKMAMLSITWYEYQLAAIAKGKRVNPNLCAWRVVFQMIGRMRAHSFSMRADLKSEYYTLDGN